MSKLEAQLGYQRTSDFSFPHCLAIVQRKRAKKEKRNYSLTLLYLFFQDTYP